MDELEGKSIGERIQTLRERTGKSRAVVAGLVGRTDSWLKAVERGRLLPPRLDMLVRIAEAIGVRELSELIGDQGFPLGMLRRSGHDAVPAIREAIEATPLAVRRDPMPDTGSLADRAASAWRTWHASPTPRADVGRVLPELLRDCQRAVRVLDGADRRRAYGTLSEVYALCEQALAWVAEPALLWLTADRCMHAAQQADDPLTLGGAAWVMGNVQRATSREEDAVALVNEAADLLAPRLDSDDDRARAMWGALRLHSALTLGRLGREGDALRAWDEGSAMADRMPAGYAHPWTLFGTANASVIGVSVHVDLHKGGRAIDQASMLDPDAVPSLDRRARLWLEIARSYHQRGDSMATLGALQRVAAVSTESLSCHPIGRGLTGELVTSGGPMVSRDARSLARTLGMTV